MGSDNLREELRALVDKAEPALASGCTCRGDECDGICGRGRVYAWDLDPQKVRDLLAAHPAPSLAGHREQIAEVLHREKHSEGCFYTNPVNCDQSWRADQEADALLTEGGLVDLGSEETLARVSEAIDTNYDEDRYFPVYDEAGNRCINSAAARAVLAALTEDKTNTQGEQE